MMNRSKGIRQRHRWLSIAFTAVVAAMFIALGTGHDPASRVYVLPLLPLAMLTGQYMFFLPYAAKWRGRRSAGLPK